MFKKVCVCALIVLSACAAMVCAAEPPKKYLSEADVQAFLKNFRQIEKDFEALGESYEEILDISEDGSDAGYPASLASLLAVDVPADVERILKKNGLSSPSFAKYMVISYSIMILYMEKGMKEQQVQYASMPEVAQSLDQAMAEIETMKKEIHPSDLALVGRNLDALAALVSGE